MIHDDDMKRFIEPCISSGRSRFHITTKLPMYACRIHRLQTPGFLLSESRYKKCFVAPALHTSDFGISGCKNHPKKGKKIYEEKHDETEVSTPCPRSKTNSVLKGFLNSWSKGKATLGHVQPTMLRDKLEKTSKK